jgi:hypothetical protein
MALNMVHQVTVWSLAGVQSTYLFLHVTNALYGKEDDT